MASRRIKVLMDLSISTEGFSGIPHITRLMYRLFRTMPELDVTGLFYCARGTAQLVKFSDSPLPADRLLGQALFLEGLTARQLPPSPLWFMRAYSKLRRLLINTIMPTRSQELVSDVFWDVLWRNYLSHGMGPSDLNLVKHGKFILSTYSTVAHEMRLRFGLPAQNIDTTGYDIAFFMDSRATRIHPDTKKISYYHDLIPIVRPDCLAHRGMIGAHQGVLGAIQNETTFVCNTDHTKSDLNKAFPVTTDKSVVIPYPLGSQLYPMHDLGRVQDIFQARHNNVCGKHSSESLAAPVGSYLFTCSTLEPRKNYPSLIRAFTHVVRQPQYKDLRLVIVGNPGWQWKAIGEQMRPLIEQGKIIHLTNVMGDEMRVLYSNARALVFASFYEGFGMAPVEAMQCDTPVILSDIPPHRDVAGNAAIYFNPYDVDSIADSIVRLLYSDEAETLRTTLIERGRERLHVFDTDLIQGKWLDLFERVTDGRALPTATPEPRRELQAA